MSAACTKRESNKIPLSYARILGIFTLASMVGCSVLPDVRHQEQFHNPFPQLRTVAVIPFRNQSELPTLSGERVSAAYSHELQAVPGFEVLPVGVVRDQLAAYEALILKRPAATAEDFQGFARHLGVDAVLQGAITDFDPYYPPRLTLKVNWYTANPAFHEVPAGYGLPWGTEGEKEIPEWVRLEAERELAAEQLATQTPHAEDVERATLWPDPEGFIPPPPSPVRPAPVVSQRPVLSHMATYNGSDEDFTSALADYYYFRDDSRFGGWEAYLQRSEDFTRFCCHLHIRETLLARGGGLEKRTTVRWPLGRYER